MCSGGESGAADARRPAQCDVTWVASADEPTAFATRPGDPALYVAEQTGRVIAIRNGTVAKRPVLDLTSRVLAQGEEGLLGMTFSPDGAHLYVHYSGETGATTVDEYAFTPRAGGGGTADPSSRRELLTYFQPEPNHKGGQLAFGPTGALYLGLGDGGSAGDRGGGHAPGGNGQSKDTLLGKIVRTRRSERRRHDLRPRASEPLAVLVRPPQRRPLDR